MTNATVTSEASVTSKNVSKVFFLRLIQYPILALYVTLVPRMMGPDIYGKYALLISFVAMTSALLGFGLTEILARFVPEFEVEKESSKIVRFSTNILAFKFLVDLIVTIILFFVLELAYGGRFPAIYFILVNLILFVGDLGGVPYALLFGLNKFGKYSFNDPARRALSLSFVLILFHYLGLLGALLSSLLVEATLSALYFYWTRENFSWKDFRIDLSFLLPYLKFGFIFYLSWGVLNVWQRMGNALIEYITKDSRQVALYDIPNQIYLITATFNLFLITSLVPIFTKLLLTGKEGKVTNWTQLIAKYVGIVCTLILGSYILVGPHLIPLVFGSEYTDIYSNGIILLLGVFPMALTQIGYVFSIVYKEPRKYLYAQCFALITFLIAAFVFIPGHASMGAAIATFVSCMFFAVGVGFLFRDRLLPCLSGWLKVVALGVVFVPFTFFRGEIIMDFLLLISSLAVYALLLFASKALRVNELKEIYAAIRS